MSTKPPSGTRDFLPDEVRRAASDWEAVLEALRMPERPLPWLEGRVMHAVTTRVPEPGWLARLRMLARPRYAAAIAAA